MERFELTASGSGRGLDGVLLSWVLWSAAIVVRGEGGAVEIAPGE